MMKHLNIYTRTQGDSFSNVHCIVTYNLHVVTIFLSGIVAISFCVNSSDYRVFTLCGRGSDDYMNNLPPSSCYYYMQTAEHVWE